MKKFKEYIKENIIEKLRIAKGKIKHSGDYGFLLYNPKIKKVFWVMADGDGGDGLTTEEEIEKILKIDGIEDIEIADEYFPKDYSKNNPGDWIKIKD